MNDWMPCSKLERRTPPKKVRSPRLAMRMVRILGLVVALVVVGFILRRTVRPFVLCYVEARSVQETRAELNNLQRQNEDLRRQRACLESKSGSQAEARNQGWVMPGERNLVIENPRGTADDSRAPSQP